MLVYNRTYNYICSMTKMIQIDNGQKFGRYQVIERVQNIDSRPHYKCLCECGSLRIISGKYLRKGLSKSCGCYGAEQRKKASTKHGHASRVKHSKEYQAWSNMKNRCLDENNKQYKDYGGRGITLCKEWLDFENFINDMGFCNGLTLDRIDVNGNYEPNNCKWSSQIEQQRNKRNNHIVFLNNVPMTLVEASEKIGVKYDCLRQRVKRSNNKYINI
jgi:hypothetical protein